MIFVGGKDDDDWYWEPMQVRFEWVALGSGSLSDTDPSLIAGKSGPFFGAIYRSADYPDAFEVDQEPEFGRFGVDLLNGTKIGGVPHLNQSEHGVFGQFLCQLSSVVAFPEVPYPWVELRREPLDLWSAENSYHCKGNIVMFGDGKYIHIYRDDAGHVCSAFDSY